MQLTHSIAEIEIFKSGPNWCSVCVPNNLTREQIEERIPSIPLMERNGQWKITKKTTFPTGDSHPRPCDRYAERTHYYLTLRKPCRRKLPYCFPDLDADEWIEIYNALDWAYKEGEFVTKDIGNKIPPDGRGMAGNEKLQRRIPEKGWIEIYLSVESKLKELVADPEDGDGIMSREALREWKRQLRGILEKLAEVHDTFIGPVKKAQKHARKTA